MADSQGTDTAPRLTRKGQAARQRIVSAAAELMYEHGVTGTTLEAVKSRAGVSSSQLYHYFGDRQDLVHAVIAHQTEAVLSSQPPRLDSLAALDAWREQTIAIGRAVGTIGGCPIGSLAGELAKTDAQAREELLAALNRWEAAIRDGLRAMQTRGELHQDADPDALATALLAALQGGLLLTHLRHDARPLEAALEATLDLIRRLCT